MSEGGSDQVQVMERVSAKALIALANKDILAIRVPNFCDNEVCNQVMRVLSNTEGKGYRVEPDFKKVIGGALFDGAGDEEALTKYFSMVPEWFEESRSAFSPYMAPSDKMRLNLQEIWPSGCNIERVGGNLTYVGLLRGFKEGAEARPHQDMTNWDLPQFEEAQSLKTQLSCLTYLACAESGGELELWDKEIETRSEYEATQLEGDYGLNRQEIGSPDAVIAPKIGELIVFNARRVHAVRRISKGHRYSQSFFIGYRGDDQALSVFS